MQDAIFPGDLVILDDGFLDPPLCGIVLKTKSLETFLHCKDVYVMWTSPLPSNYTPDGIESLFTWIPDALLKVISSYETR